MYIIIIICKCKAIKWCAKKLKYCKLTFNICSFVDVNNNRIM